MTHAYGYLIDHVPAQQRCCDLHNIHCEPPRKEVA